MRAVNDAPVVADEPINHMAIHVGKGEPLEPVMALCTLGVWAVTPEWRGPSLRWGSRFVLTHVPTGFKLGPSLTERDAMRTLRRLYDTAPDFGANGSYPRGPIVRATLYACFPARNRPSAD